MLSVGSCRSTLSVGSCRSRFCVGRCRSRSNVGSCRSLAELNFYCLATEAVDSLTALPRSVVGVDNNCMYMRRLVTSSSTREFASYSWGICLNSVLFNSVLSVLFVKKILSFFRFKSDITAMV